MKDFWNCHKIALLGSFVLLGSCQEKKVTNNNETESDNVFSEEVGKIDTSRSTDKDPLTVTKSIVRENVRSNPEALEKARIFLFAVPIENTAIKERQEAWIQMNPTSTGLTREQYEYACDLLDRHVDSPPLTKLTFWQICNTRIIYQNPGGAVRGFGGLGVVYGLTQEKMKATLYSAIGKSPDSYSYDEAVTEGIRILTESVRSPAGVQNTEE